MSTAYSPRAGSVADRVIHHLRTLAPHAELTSGALAEALGIDPAGIGPSLAPAVEHRAIFRRTKGGHAKSPEFWSLHDHSSARAPSRQNGAEPDDGKPIQRTIPANRAPPLPIVPPLFPALAEAIEHAAPEGWTPLASRRLEVEPPPDFRCGLFSDGTFVLTVDGQTLTLNAKHTRRLVAFFDRIVTEPAA